MNKRFVALLLSVWLFFSPVATASGRVPAQGQGQEPPKFSFFLGTVYEVDKERYRDYVETLRRSNPNLNENALVLDAERFIDERDDVVVNARQLSSNQIFQSPSTGGSGEYMIRNAPPGTFDFVLRHDEVDYPVQQRLDVNVELSYVAELCFVIDREEGVAWMVSDGPRRTEEVPPWVPRECVSALSACLALLTDTEGRLPDGLLLLLAGGAAAVGIGIGINSTEQVESSSVTRPQP